MLLEDLDVLLKTLRRTPLYGNSGHEKAVEFGREAIHRLVPHRDPFLLVDSIDGLDAKNGLIRGKRRIQQNDPVFAGHFPDQPIYPGVLQVEAMGQLALCLARLTDSDNANQAPPQIRAIKIHHALFMAPVYPDDDLTIHAGIIDDNGFTAISTGQIFKGSVLCSCSVQEVCFVD